MKTTHVVSLKGGVGKTTISVLMARARAKMVKKPVLLIDADLTGSCLGDVLEGGANPPWGETPGLESLICGRPECLSEALKSPPIFVARPAPKIGAPPLKATASSSKKNLLFIHSSPHGSEVSPPILQALLAHESAGGWVRHVMDRIVEAARDALGLKLGGVVVDHAPGFGALPSTLVKHLGDESGTGGQLQGVGRGIQRSGRGRAFRGRLV